MSLAERDCILCGAVAGDRHAPTCPDAASNLKPIPQVDHEKMAKIFEKVGRIALEAYNSLPPSDNIAADVGKAAIRAMIGENPDCVNCLLKAHTCGFSVQIPRPFIGPYYAPGPDCPASAKVDPGPRTLPNGLVIQGLEQSRQHASNYPPDEEPK